MEDKIKELQIWAKESKERLVGLESLIKENIDKLPKEDQDKFSTSLKDLDIKNLHKMAEKSSENIINHIKNSFDI